MVAKFLGSFSLTNRNPLWVCIIGGLSVAFISLIIGHKDFNAQEQELYIEMRRVEDDVTDRFLKYSSIVEAVGAFYASSQVVDESEWMSFLLGMKVPFDKDVGGMAFMSYDALKADNVCSLQNIYVSQHSNTFSHEYVCSLRQHMHDEIIRPRNHGRSSFTITDISQDTVLVFHPIRRIGLSGVAILSVQLDSFFASIPLNSDVDIVNVYDPDAIQQNKNLFYKCNHGDEEDCTVDETLIHLSFEDIFYVSGHDWHIGAYMHYVPSIFTLSTFVLGQLINFLTFAFLKAQQQLRRAAEVTAQRSQRILVANEQRYKLAIDGTNDGIWDWDLVNDSVWYSEHWKSMLGIAADAEDSLTMFFERVHYQDKEYVQEYIDAHLKNKKPYDVTLRMLHEDGEYRWIRSRGDAIFENGRPVRMIGSHTDITAEKEYALQAEQFRFIVENSLELVSIVNSDGSLEYMNQAGLDIIGYPSLEDALGINVMLFRTPEGQVQFEEEVFPTLKKEGFWRGISHFRNRLTGEVVITDQSFYTVHDKETGKELFYASSARDITDSVAAQQEIDRQKTFMEKMITNLPVGVFAKSARENGRIITWNDKMGEIVDIPKHDVIGMRDADFLDDADLVRSIEQTDRDVFESGDLIELSEIITETESGPKKFVHTYKFPIYDQYGDPEILVGIVVDITKRIQNEKDLMQAKRDADSANIAKSEFLANMSHEIRTPLNGVIGMCDLMERSDLTAKQQKFMSVMKTSSHNLLNIVNDILDISKLEAGQFNLEMITVQLRQLCSDIIETHRSKAKEKGLDLVLDIARDVPQHIVSDPTRVTQVLNNLLSNSIKFTDSGSVSLHVTSKEVSPYTHEITMDVIDTGIGISADKQELVFDKFSQADSSTTRKFGGTGLGLSIVREILEKMGGSISLTSTPNEGTTFTAHFTVGITNADGEALLSPEKNNSVNALSSLNILVAEDNPTNQQVIEWMLEDLGCQFTICENGAEALNALETSTSRYHAVLMDCQMPVLDGYETTRKIRSSDKAYAKIPIIAVTANAMQGDREKCLESGMDEYISKPIDEEKLFSLLKQTMN